MRRALVLFVTLLIVPLAWHVQANDGQFGACPDTDECETVPSDGGEFPPRLVTGHTVYASWVQTHEREPPWSYSESAPGVGGAKFPSMPLDDTLRRDASAFPDGAEPAGEAEVESRVRQAECVVWVGGTALDQNPAVDGFGWGAHNAFPSDEDHLFLYDLDVAGQDYDFDRVVEDCEPDLDGMQGSAYALPTDFAAVMGYYEDAGPLDSEFGNYAVVTERGDCDPRLGDDFRFRGRLDFIDPNGMPHEVLEFDYVCPLVGAVDELWHGVAEIAPRLLADQVKTMFPWTYTDPFNTDGCEYWDTPIHNGPLGPNGPTEPGFVDNAHKCNGTYQDAVTERLWITRVHEPVFDAATHQEYTFALQVDTCAGFNIFEGVSGYVTSIGLNAQGASDGWGAGRIDFPSHSIKDLHDAWDTWTMEVGPTVEDRTGQRIASPVGDICMNGSALSFDDTRRDLVVHTGPPAGIGTDEVLRGNSLSWDWASPDVGKHRSDCRENALNWLFNVYPNEQIGTWLDCYPEDHKTALIDIYVFDRDPTWSFEQYSLG